MHRSTLMFFTATTILLNACGDGKGGMRANELDPDTAAEVRRINLENYAGDWLVPGTKGEIYLSIDEQGYYWAATDRTDKVVSGDFGRISHRAPGKMLFYSDRSDCKHPKGGEFLWLDHVGSIVRLRDSDDEEFALELLAVDKRERLRGLPCGKIAE